MGPPPTGTDLVQTSLEEPNSFSDLKNQSLKVLNESRKSVETLLRKNLRIRLTGPRQGRSNSRGEKQTKLNEDRDRLGSGEWCSTSSDTVSSPADGLSGTSLDSSPMSISVPSSPDYNSPGILSPGTEDMRET
ncbi:hypothetical protein ACHWQZ_G012636 [Mnemiopsis leidyi]